MNKTANDKTKQIYMTTANRTCDGLHGDHDLYADVLGRSLNTVNRKGLDSTRTVIRAINEKIQNV